MAEVLAEILAEMKTQGLVLGGQISKAFPLMEEPLKKGLSHISSLKTVVRARNIDCAAQLGAAREVFKALKPETDGGRRGESHF